jgi:hypothetical protein
MLLLSVQQKRSFKNKIVTHEILFVFILISGYLLNTIYYLYHRGKEFPYNTFLWLPDHKFTDFSSNWNALRDPGISNDSKYLVLDYYPIWNFIHFLFSRISNFEIAKFIYLSLIIIISYNLIYEHVVKKFSSQSILVSNSIVLLSYPVLFVFDRGNIEFLAFCFLFAFFVIPEKHLYLKILAYSLSCLIKPWPLIMLPVLVYKYRKKFLLTFSTVTLISIVCVPLFLNFYYFENFGISLDLNRNYQTSVDYTKFMVFDQVGLAYSHSLYNLISILTSAVNVGLANKTLLLLYTIASVGTIIFVLYDFFKSNYEIWKFYGICIILMDLLPYVSADYKLLNIYILLYLLLKFSNSDRTRFNSLFILIAVLMIPKNIFIYGYTLGSALNPIILVIIFLILFRSRSRAY